MEHNTPIDDHQDGNDQEKGATSHNVSEENVRTAERQGLTTEQAERLYESVGFNELPHIEVSLVYMFFTQFTGVMPYMLEIACILALAVESWIDFAIISAILLSNGCLGFLEELKAKKSLVSEEFVI